MEEKRIAIMQPYFFPYIGYFHLLQAADTLVLYDNIQYTKKGWINRNRYLHDAADTVFSIPLRKASDYLCIDQREISVDFDRRKLLNRIRSAYQKAPHFASTFELFTHSVECSEPNLFRFIKHSLLLLRDHLGITTDIVDSSSIEVDHSARGQDRVLAICGALKASMYINAAGGTALYDQEAFETRGIELRFIQSENRTYQQFNHSFVPWLSILDVMMFNSLAAVQDFVQYGFSLFSNTSLAK
ncbi:MAG: WbqC family protein [Planctomycetales bacterium]|nr:WbqC family protein [Planctomycetales bacterium]